MYVKQAKNTRKKNTRILSVYKTNLSISNSNDNCYGNKGTSNSM